MAIVGITLCMAFLINLLMMDHDTLRSFILGSVVVWTFLMLISASIIVLVTNT